MQMLKRRVKVSEMYLRGTTLAMIGEQLGVSQATVNNDLEACREVWREKMSQAFSQKKAEELAKLDTVEEEAWNGWRKSIVDREVMITRKEAVIAPKKQSRKGGHRLVPIKETTEKSVFGQAGDPRFLEVISKVIETRLKIMGVFKDQGTGQTVVNINWQEMLRGDGPEQRRIIIDNDPIEQQIRNVENLTGIQEEIGDNDAAP